MNCFRRKLWRKAKAKKPTSNHSSIFTDTFLQDKNQDCLEQVLSFLTFKELVASGKTCKNLQCIILDSSAEESNINLIWHGAEIDLVKPHDRRGYFEGPGRFGKDAREHCHLFMMASAAAEAYERSAENGEIAEDRMMVDGVLANLMSVRGFDAEGIAEKKAMAEAWNRSYDDDDDVDGEDQEEGHRDDVTDHHDFNEAEDSEEVGDGDEGDENQDYEDFASHDDSYEGHEGNEEELEEPGERHDDENSQEDVFTRMFERAKEYSETCQKFEELTPTEITYHHKVFVRITQATSGELICQGFCEQKQKLPWAAGLEQPFLFKPQGLEIMLNFESIWQSDEVKFYLQSLAGDMVDIDGPNLAFQVTAVVISEKDFSCHCLFQQDQSQYVKLRDTSDVVTPDNSFVKHTFGLHPTWGVDTVQLGLSPYSHQYCLDFSLFLVTEESALVVPYLEVDIKKDTSNMYKMALRQLAAQYEAGEISEEMMNSANRGEVIIFEM